MAEAWLHINAREHYSRYLEKAGVYGGNVEITAIKEIYKESFGLRCLPEDQITQLLTDIVGQYERKVSLLFSGEPDNLCQKKQFL
jgi:hypothetical protein